MLSESQPPPATEPRRIASRIREATESLDSERVRDQLPAMGLPPFHLAFPVDDLDAARRFYGELLGCPEGRSADEWIDFNLYGHQIVAHLAPEEARIRATNRVDGDEVPVPHFGIVLPMNEWKALAARLEKAAVEFVIAPTVRFEN